MAKELKTSKELKKYIDEYNELKDKEI